MWADGRFNLQTKVHRLPPGPAAWIRLRPLWELLPYRAAAFKAAATCVTRAP